MINQTLCSGIIVLSRQSRASSQFVTSQAPLTAFHSSPYPDAASDAHRDAALSLLMCDVLLSEVMPWEVTRAFSDAEYRVHEKLLSTRGFWKW